MHSSSGFCTEDLMLREDALHPLASQGPEMPRGLGRFNAAVVSLGEQDPITQTTYTQKRICSTEAQGEEVNKGKFKCWILGRKDTGDRLTHGSQRIPWGVLSSSLQGDGLG